MASHRSFPQDKADLSIDSALEASGAGLLEDAEVEDTFKDDEELSPVREEYCDDAFKLYLREIKKAKLLSALEERELAARIATGDKPARDLMIVSNLRLVVSIAKRYRNRGLAFLDLIEEGNLGLIKAVDRFRLDKECRFSTYATWWIRQNVERALMNQSRTLRGPGHVSEEIARVYRAAGRLRNLLHREPTPEELANLLGVEVAHVQKLMVLLERTHSIDQLIGPNGNYSLKDILVDKSYVSPAHLLEGRNTYELATRLIAGFSDTEQLILKQRFGLDDEDPQTLASIGDSIGVTRERIRQIETKLLGKLKTLMGHSGIMSYC